MTSPRGKVHRFDFTAGDRSKTYTPASSTGAYTRSYSTERTLEGVALPSGASQVMGYDTAGRLTSENHVQTKRSFDYEGSRDQLAKITRTLADGGDEQTMSVAYDGLLPKSIEFGGVAAGRYEYTLGDRVLPTSEKLTVGATSITRDVALRQGPAGDQERAVHVRAQGPGRRGLEDHRRQARRSSTPTTPTGARRAAR